MKKNAYISLAALLILFYVIIRVAYLYPKWDKPHTEATISWDVFGYYLYLPGGIIYDDLGELGFIEEIFNQYHPAGDFHHAVQQPDGGYVLKYPIGMAIVYLPFFLFGHLGALISDYPADGFSWPYQFAIAMAGVFYAFMGLIISRKILLRYFSDITTAIVLGVIVLGTNYLNYTAIDGAMPHNVLFTLYAAILYLTILWHENQRWWIAGLMGLAIGLATVIRPTELMSAMIPVLWGIKDKESLIRKWRLLWEQKLQVIILGVGIFLMGLTQMIYWKIHSGSFLYYSYGEFGFDWLRPHILNGLFSFRKGWLVYTPIMAIALLGFIPLFKNHREKFLAVAAYIALNLYVVFAWEVWWYGGSFGARALVQSYAILVLPLGAAITYMLSRKYLAIAGIIFMLLCVDLNMMMTWQAHSREGNWHAESMTKAYYWKIFGNANPKKEDKKFLDVRRELKSTKGMEITTLYENDFESDTTGNLTTLHAHSGNKSYLLNADHQFTPTYTATLGELNPRKGSWIRIHARTFYTQMQWNEWMMAQVSIVFQRGDKVYRQTTARVQRVSNPWVWFDYHYEMQIPKDWQPEDIVKAYVWNAGSQTEVFVDDLKVELIQPEK